MTADNAKAMGEVRNEQDYINLLRELDKFQSWSNTWLKNFDPNKCKVLKIGHSERPKYGYNLARNKQHESVFKKNLGVDLLPDLSPEERDEVT